MAFNCRRVDRMTAMSANANKAPSDATVPEQTAAQSGDEPGARIFISYSRKDASFVERLGTAIEVRGLVPLIDRTEIYAFEDWWKRIEGMIGTADTIVFVLSPDAISSDICRREVEFASSLSKRFAPIVCRTVDPAAVPEPLRRLNFIFFDDPAKFEESLDRLAEALQTDIDWIRRHTEYGEAARRWASAGRARGLLLRSPALEEAEHWIAARPHGAPLPTADTQTFVAESRRIAIRRRNLLTGSLSAGLVIALVLAGLAYWQRGVAKTEAALAQRNFNAAQETVDSVVFDLASGLRDVEGMRVETVRRILSRAEKAVGELASRTENDPAIRRSGNAMYNVFSETYLRLGDTKLALEYAQKAVALARQLSVENPQGVTAHDDLAVSLDRTGDVLRAKGDLVAALAAYQEALAIARASAAPEPDKIELRRDITVALVKVGDVLRERGDRAGALTPYHESIEIVRALVAKQPSNPVWRRDLATNLGRFGELQVDRGELTAALTTLREAEDIARAQAAQDPENTLARRDLAASLANVGLVLSRMDDWTGAVAAYRESLGILRALAAKDPGNASWRHDIAEALNKLGDAQRSQLDAEGALASYREAREINRALAAADPDSTARQVAVVASLREIGVTLNNKGDHVGALASYREALGLAREASAKDPDNLLRRQDILKCLTIIASILMAEGDLDATLGTIREEVDLARATSAKDPHDPRWRRDVAASLAQLGQALVLKNDHKAALDLYREAIAMLRALSKDAPEQSELWLDLTMALVKMGDVLTDDKNLDGADDVYLEALAIEHEFTAKVPKEPEWRDELVATLLKLAAIGDDTVAHVREALAIAKDLQQKGQLPQPGLVDQIEQILAAVTPKPAQ
jgi:tetratricopeptide (TPR) repeat protein